MNDEHVEKYSSLWAIHSTRENRPIFRDWAGSEAEAKEKLAALQESEKDDPEEEYWIARMSEGEVASFKGAGRIPEDA